MMGFITVGILGMSLCNYNVSQEHFVGRKLVVGCYSVPWERMVFSLLGCI